MAVKELLILLEGWGMLVISAEVVVVMDMEAVWVLLPNDDASSIRLNKLRNSRRSLGYPVWKTA